MTWLPDAVVAHLREVLERPDFSGTRYQIVEEIGRGGMGVVYLARDLELQRQVALKVLDAPGPASDEARVLARLEHPGIVPVHDVGTLPDGRVFYAMKFVNGIRLDEYRRKNPPVPDVLRILWRVCETVAFAHSRGVIHRDLKPANIMVGEFGEVLVLDWGVAKVLNHSDYQPGTVVGTVAYMAPEQASGAVDQVDARSDVYALGKILSELMQDREATRSLRAIWRKAANEDRETRYAGAEELAADVSRFLNGEPVLAHRENWLERAARILQRNRTLALLLLAYLLMRSVLFFFLRR